MNRWVHEVVSYTFEEEARYCIYDMHWQRFCIRLLEFSTSRKLDNLEIYRSQCLTHNSAADQRRWEVQLSDYINVLKHSGQLTKNLEVQR